jgi:hypothetical protein
MGTEEDLDRMAGTGRAGPLSTKGADHDARRGAEMLSKEAN